MITLAITFLCLSPITLIHGAPISDYKNEVEGRSLGGMGFAFLPLLMLGVRKYLLYRYLKNQKDGSGVRVNIDAGDGYGLNAHVNLIRKGDPSFYETQVYQGPEYYPVQTRAYRKK